MQNSPIQEDTDDDLRNNPAMEGSPEMTIEFLRARLLAERSVSRAARQRADELSKRVAELEGQLKTVSLQRKKAEKATIDVLAILDNHGMSEFSEDFNSSSDQEVDQSECEVSNGSVGLKMRSKCADEYSTYGLESDPSLGRSLSWKSGKQSPHSREKKHADSSSRRRRSFSSSVFDSPRLQVGRSCRRVQRRELRLPVEEGSKNDGSRNDRQEGGVTTCSEDYSTQSDTGSQILGGNSVKPVVEVVKEKSASREDLENQGLRASAINHLNKDGGSEDMEMAMEQKAQLIGKYQEEEKAQREWEEKFREKDNSSRDSFERGNQSDVTEERDETKVHPSPVPVGSIASRDLKQKPPSEDISAINEPSKPQPNGFHSPQRASTDYLHEKKPNGTLLNGSPTTDPSVTHRAQTQEQQHSAKLGVSLTPNGYHQGDSSQRKSENFALVPHEEPNQLGSILNALQKAKLSLTQQINGVPSIQDRALGKPIGRYVGPKPEDPVGFPGLFRVPSDFHLEPNNHDSNRLLSLTQYDPTQTASDRSFSRPYSEAGSSVYGSERHYSTPSSPYRDPATRVQTWQPLEARSMSSHQPFSDPGFDSGVPYMGRNEFSDPRLVGGRSYSNPYASSPNYPVFPGFVPHIPSNQGSAMFSSSRAGMSPSNQFFHDEHGRSSPYR